MIQFSSTEFVSWSSSMRIFCLRILSLKALRSSLQSSRVLGSFMKMQLRISNDKFYLITKPYNIKLIIFNMLFYSLFLLFTASSFHLEIIDPIVLESSIFENNKLNQFYDSTIYEDSFYCTNGLLSIIQFQQSDGDQLIVFKYSDLKFSRSDVKIAVEPNAEPMPFIKNFNGVYKNFTIDAGCPPVITNSNYYNRVIITIKDYYTFSFLLNCDHMDLHKKFQFGYLLIILLCTGIVLFVSFHPRIYSIRIFKHPLSFQIKWQGFLAVSLLILVCMIVVYTQHISKKELKQYLGDWTEIQVRFYLVSAFLRYLGLLLSFFYGYVCFSQLFFHYKKILKKIPYGTKAIRITPSYSILMSTIYSLVIGFVLFLFGVWSQNWLYYNFLSILCCIGSIKMFKFNSLKNVIYTMAIVMVTMFILLIWAQIKLPRSYNDYTSDVSSPLFIQIPSLANNLYRKCSWLFIFDVFIPGTLVAFLRDYDENFHEGWRGVYTFVSIFVYFFSMLLWVGIEGAMNRYIPFCLVGYPILMLAILSLAHNRNEWKTLWNGYFHMSLNVTALQIIEGYKSGRYEWKQLMNNDMFESMKYDEAKQSDMSSQLSRSKHLRMKKDE